MTPVLFIGDRPSLVIVFNSMSTQIKGTRRTFTTGSYCGDSWTTRIEDGSWIDVFSYGFITQNYITTIISVSIAFASWSYFDLSAHQRDTNSRKQPHRSLGTWGLRKKWQPRNYNILFRKFCSSLNVIDHSNFTEMFSLVITVNLSTCTFVLCDFQWPNFSYSCWFTITVCYECT